jgi:hypothetical protein
VQCAEGGRTIEAVARRSTSIQATPHSTAIHRLQCGQPYRSTVSCTTRLHCAYYRATAMPTSLLRRRLGSPASCQACPYQTTQSSCTPTRGFLVDDASGLPRTLAEEGVLISVVGSQIRHTPQRDKARRPLCSEVVHDHDQYIFHSPCSRALPPPSTLQDIARADRDNCQPFPLPSWNVDAARNPCHGRSLGRQHDCCPGHHQRLEVLHTITITVMYYFTASSFDITPKWLSLTTSL